MKEKTFFKNLLFIILFALIFLPMWIVPFLQEQFPSMQVAEPVGFFGKTKYPNFTGKRWMANSFQREYESFVKAKNPLQPTAIRLKSQLDFSLYGDIMHANILNGKNGFLFQKEGCEAFIGRDFMGKDWIAEKTRKLSFISKKLKEEGIETLVLLPPLKARIFSENLPDFYQKNKSDLTNWKMFSEILNQENINVEDFSFLLEKEYEYPLYPPSGQHWTKYGSAIAAEKIIEQLEDILNVNMVEMNWRDSIELSAAQVEFDNELVAGANFIWNPPLKPLPYPKVKYIENDSTIKPKVLSIGDSFYKLIYEFGFVQGLFHAESTFWYYNKEVFPQQLRNGKILTNRDFDVLEEIRKREVIIFTLFEDNLERFAFGFVDNVYTLLQEESNLE